MTSQELREVRLKMDLTISQMAEALQTPRGTYQKWERGERRVPGIVEVALKGVKL